MSWRMRWHPEQAWNWGQTFGSLTDSQVDPAPVWVLCCPGPLFSPGRLTPPHQLPWPTASGELLSGNCLQLKDACPLPLLKPQLSPEASCPGTLFPAEAGRPTPLLGGGTTAPEVPGRWSASSAPGPFYPPAADPRALPGGPQQTDLRAIVCLPQNLTRATFSAPESQPRKCRESQTTVRTQFVDFVVLSLYKGLLPSLYASFLKILFYAIFHYGWRMFQLIYRTSSIGICKFTEQPKPTLITFSL